MKSIFAADHATVTPVMKKADTIAVLRASQHGSSSSPSGSPSMRSKSLPAEKTIHPTTVKLPAVVQPLNISFRNLEFKVVKDDKTINILKGVSGQFKAGRLTCIMGSSGAGKTTLLSCLAGFTDNVKGASMSGEVLLNNILIQPDQVRKLSGFVFQEDTILDTSTVREHLMFAARLRLDQALTDRDRAKIVDDTMESLGLLHIADTAVGNELTRGISGGERKRTSISTELVCNPDLLFLDEPTTGLDAYTAFHVIRKLKALAVNTGKTIVSTIHQPSSDVFNSFDDLVLMAKGKVIYCGPIGENGIAVVDYFASVGYQCPRYHNPADWIFTSLLNTSVDVNSGQMVDKESIVAHLISSWESRSATTDAPDAAPQANDSDVSLSETYIQERISEIDSRKASVFTQLRALSSRVFINQIRNPILSKAKLASGIILALVIGLLYLRTGNDQISIQSRLGACFFLAVNSIFNSVLPALSTFALEKEVFRREYRTGMYSLPAYFFSKVVTETPINVIIPLVSVTIQYFMMTFQLVATNWILFALAVIVQTQVGCALGMFFSALFRDLPAALTAVPVMILPLMLFSGFFYDTEEIPPWFRWISWLSPMKYTFEILERVEFEGLGLECKPDQLIQTINGTSFCPITSGDQVIESREVNYIGLGGLFGSLISHLALFQICAYLALYRAATSKQ